MGPRDKRGLDDDITASAGKPLAPDDEDVTASAGKPLPRQEDPSRDPTRGVNPADPTVDLMPDRSLQNAMRVTVPHAPPVSEPIPPSSVGAPPPDSDRILWVREQPEAPDTVSAQAEVDANRVLWVREMSGPGSVETLSGPSDNPLKAPWEQSPNAPTVNVLPDPGLLNSPRRLVSEPAVAPTVNVVPALPAPPPLAPVAAPRWGPEPTANAAPTLNVLPDGGLINSPQRIVREPEVARTVNIAKGDERDETINVVHTGDIIVTNAGTVRTDPDPTQLPFDPEPPADATMKLDLPAAAKVVATLDGVAPRVRLSPPMPAPVVPAPPSAPAPPVHVATVRTEPPVVVSDAVAHWVPDAAPQTVPSQPPVEAWRESPEVQNWQPDELDRTRIMSAAQKKVPGLRAPRLRDVLVLLVGFALMVGGMVIAHRDTHDGKGPLPAEKIKPPPDYIAPRHAQETAPYESPEKVVSDMKTIVSEAAAAAKAPAGGGAAGPAPTNAASALPAVMRAPAPRCAVNVPAMLETQATWVLADKKKLLQLRLTPRREAITRVNLFVAFASNPEGAKLERTENAAVYFDVLLEPDPAATTIRVMLECECGLAHADVQATIDRKSLDVEVKYKKLPPPEVMVAKGGRRR